MIVRAMYGIDGLRWMPSAPRSPGPDTTRVAAATTLHDFAVPSFSRSVAAGGGLYSTVVYLALRAGDQSCLLRYDPLADDFDPIRSSNVHRLLARATGRPEYTLGAASIIVATRFGGNIYKYQEFSYRLWGLDTGVVLGAAFDALGDVIGAARASFLFADDLLSRLLNRPDSIEAAYALIDWHPAHDMGPLVELANQFDPTGSGPQPQSLLDLSGWPLLHTLHRAAQWSVRHVERRAHVVNSIDPPKLPVAPFAIRKVPTVRETAHRVLRESSAPTALEVIPAATLVHLLRECSRGFRSDVTNTYTTLAHILLYLVVRSVEGLTPGVYCFEPRTSILRVVSVGDPLVELRRAQTGFGRGVAHELVSLVLVPVGDMRTGVEALGARWYRIVNMHAGIVVSRAYRVLQEGFQCLPHLGYSVERMDRLLNLPPELTSLVEIFIGGGYGPPRVRLPWQGRAFASTTSLAVGAPFAGTNS